MQQSPQFRVLEDEDHPFLRPHKRVEPDGVEEPLGPDARRHHRRLGMYVTTACICPSHVDILPDEGLAGDAQLHLRLEDQPRSGGAVPDRAPELEELRLIAAAEGVRVYGAALHTLHAHVDGLEAHEFGFLVAFEVRDEVRDHPAQVFPLEGPQLDAPAPHFIERPLQAAVLVVAEEPEVADVG